MSDAVHSDGILSVKNLTCLRNDRLLFSGIHFALNPGDVLHVHGANGVGKSSLLRLLCGLLDPAEGEVLWQGRPSSVDPIEFSRAVGYLGHKLGLKDRLTAAENVMLFVENDPSSSAESPAAKTTQFTKRTEWALERMGVLSLKNHLCETLSAGQKQRVALARLLAKNCSVWLLDEPFTAVDNEGIAALESVLVEHVKQGGIVVLTSHQPVELRGLSLQTLKL